MRRIKAVRIVPLGIDGFRNLSCQNSCSIAVPGSVICTIVCKKYHRFTLIIVTVAG